MKRILMIGIMLTAIIGCSKGQSNQTQGTQKGKTANPYYSKTDTTKLDVSDAEWKKILPPFLYAVAREASTERAFTGKYWDSDTKGTYYCAVCGNKLFLSEAKFQSDCGWPSFFEPVRQNSVIYKEDNSHGMNRIEVLCGRCDSHLGHIFNDGPPPTHKRFCMNSVSLDFEPLGTVGLN
ncbi:peptide-methionine (R)-S-oxide reductase MsrB [Echinicola soli]|uniref:peptide-methionine (R)-S-oxide reductase n=1 Tax=Echinicola soli TaxID=2591634 RepID=A0A514CM51_9BACT|nr:peptide-methionine (R)-S-oxide reductase MsrB [Echinicola soli]QDH80903.1 peptide-methionine (R)-S-oxide reductase MsrB [Echinicola soli]